ncbi:MAG: dTDP-4-dehydrorhamnose 3,5-epimerase [Bacteroidota bacterium]
MLVDAVNIPGVFKITPSPIKDERGEFFRYYCKDTFYQNGIDYEFVQFNHSINKVKGTLRGMHYQVAPYAEAKLIRCTRGAIYDVYVDLRQDSDKFLQWGYEILSEANYSMLLLPPGVAHGFITMEPDTHILYHHSSFYNPKAERGLRFDDPLIDIEWPMKPEVMSQRDMKHTFLTKAFKGISV